MVVTRRNAASAEPTQPALERGSQRESTAELPKKRTRRAKAASAHAESVVKTQSVTKASSASRAVSSATTTTAVSTFSRNTRAAKAAGVGSPLRALDQPTPRRPTEKKRKRTRAQTASETPEPEYAQSEQAQDENSDDQGLFFSHSKPLLFSPQQSPQVASLEDNESVLRSENFQLRARVTVLETRVTDLENISASILEEVHVLRSQMAAQHGQYVAPRSSGHSFQSFSQSPFQHTPRHLIDRSSGHSKLQTGQVQANSYAPEFDNDLMHVEETSSVQPVFVNGSESAIALLHKIENAAKESARIEPSNHHNSETPTNYVTMEHSPRQSAPLHINQSTTPSRPTASPSGFFSRSLSALKSTLGFAASTPKVPPTPVTPQVPSSTPTRPLPPPESITEALSVPPTPVGERVKTPVKKKRTNTMLKVLLKGIEPNEKAKAEEWAKQVLPKLKNDPAFHNKRKRLETPVLFQDLNHFPSSKPWETGFGDPLADLDDEDVVPVWAVFLDMAAEDEEHKAKKHKNVHGVATDDDNIPSINEQYAATNSARSSPMLHDSHGQSTSLLDFHPRRSVDPSPIFDTPVSHHQGGNVFSELQGHDNAAQIRANDRESLLHATKQTVQVHNPTMGSFSVPEDSDDEDSTVISEPPEVNDTPLWTQRPPPAPVPAHAPLPGGPPIEAPSAPAPQQPVDEIERQRQKLMKHTPAKPSRLREAMYPSPSLKSDAGNESILVATPIQMDGSTADMFADIPTAEVIELDIECQAALDTLVESDEYKKQKDANPWPKPIITYDEDSEELSPV